MANRFICLFFTIVIAHTKPMKTYFLSDNLEMNLPDRYADPIDENWQDKRSIANEYSSSSRKIDNFPSINNKESTDLDYRNGNADVQANEVGNLQKRESEMDQNFDEV